MKRMAVPCRCCRDEAVAQRFGQKVSERLRIVPFALKKAATTSAAR